MASRDAVIIKRARAVERIRRATGIEFAVTKGGPEYQHANDLEQVADWIEAQPRGVKSAAVTKPEEAPAKKADAAE